MCSPARFLLFFFAAPVVRDLNISVSDLTNTSATLSWQPPKHANGVVRHYYVHYYLDDVSLSTQQPQQLDMIDTSDEQQTVNERRRVMSYDTKVRKSPSAFSHSVSRDIVFDFFNKTVSRVHFTVPPGPSGKLSEL